MKTLTETIEHIRSGNYSRGECMEMLIACDLRYSHTSCHMGYHTKKRASVEPYKGRYGHGAVIHSNDPRTTQYHTVDYYLIDTRTPTEEQLYEADSVMMGGVEK